MTFPDQAYTQRAHTIVDQATDKAVNIYDLMVRRFKRILEQVDTFQGAGSSLYDNAADEIFIHKHADLLLDSFVTEDALARSCLIEKDVAFSLRAHRRPAQFVVAGMAFDGLDLGWFACSDGAVKISFDVTPEQVLQQLRERAFTISGIENDELLKAIQSKLEEYVREGKTYREFLVDASQLFESFGVTPLAPYRIQTVFRTNLYNAYSAAQLDQINQMRDRFPMWRYVAILDSATRPDHAALNGKIFRVGEGPYPPIDYNCRCTAQHLHMYQVDEERIVPSENVSLPIGYQAFHERGGLDRYLTQKKAEMDPKIRNSVQKSIY